MDFVQEKADYRGKILSLSLSRRKRKESSLEEEEATKRFAQASNDELECFKKKPTSKNTQHSQLWSFNVYKEWLNSREEDDSKCVVEDLWSSDAKKVCNMLCRFVVEARQRSGEPYSPKTILQMMINLQSYAL